MIYQTCGENEKLFTKIFRIKGDSNNNVINTSFNDALNGSVYINLKSVDNTMGPLLPRKAIVRSALINFYGQTYQKSENSNQNIAIPLQARITDIYQYVEYTSNTAEINITISGPKIEDETTLTAKREQLVDFDLVVFYSMYE